MSERAAIEESELVLTPQEARAKLKMGKTKFHTLLSSGEIRSIRHGRWVRLRQEDLESFLKNHRV